MTTDQIAKRLTELCRQGKIQEAQKELYANNIESTEPDHFPIKSAKGKEAVAEKGRQFASLIEERHGFSFSDPLVCGHYFTAAMVLDVTLKGRGRTKLEEICVYEVSNGKIVAEQFFF